MAYLAIRYRKNYAVTHVHIAYNELQCHLQNVSAVLESELILVDAEADKKEESLLLQVEQKVKSMLQEVQRETQDSLVTSGDSKSKLGTLDDMDLPENDRETQLIINKLRVRYAFLVSNFFNSIFFYKTTKDCFKLFS